MIWPMYAVMLRQLPTSTEAKKGKNKPAHNNYLKASAMLGMNFHICILKKLTEK